MFLTQAVGKREDPVWSNPPKKHTSYNIFCLQYRHRYIQTQVLCCTDVLPPRSLCATQRGYHGTLGVFCHMLYSKGTSSHRWESGERNFWLREGTGARSGICSQVYFAKKIPEAVPFTSKQKHDHQWTVIVSLRLHTQEAPKLGRHSVFPLLPQLSLSSKDMADNLSEIYTEQSKMLLPSGRCDWLFSIWGCWWRVTRKLLHLLQHKASRSEITFCGQVGTDTWCMAASLTPPAVCNMIQLLDL